MKRLIYIIIAICILGSQSVWAFSDIEIDDHQKETYSYVAEQQNDISDDCDHFCHASAHLSGLFAANSFDFSPSNSNSNSIVKQLTYSINYRPPVPPPNS